MGLTYITTRVSNLAKTGEPYETQFLVETGSIDCLAPADVLHQAGILIEGKDVYELANGDLVEYPYGYGRIAFMGDEAVSRIIFGPPACEPLKLINSHAVRGEPVEP